MSTLFWDVNTVLGRLVDITDFLYVSEFLDFELIIFSQIESIKSPLQVCIITERILYRGPNIAKRFLPENFGNIGTFGDMGTEINFFVKKWKNT
jgi:hypothetical protein